MRTIKFIIIHCSATPDGYDFTAQDIDRWHRERGFRKIGYHYVIRLDGTVERGRQLSEVGAHCSGYNKQSVGICYVGGLDAVHLKPADTRTSAQKRALRQLLEHLHTMFPKARVVGHRDLNRHKACPCYDVGSD